MDFQSYIKKEKKKKKLKLIMSIEVIRKRR